LYICEAIVGLLYTLCNVKMGTLSLENMESVSGLLSLQCGLCEGLIEAGISTPCCTSTVCKACAVSHLKTNSCCWVCESPIEEQQLLENKETSVNVEKIISGLLSCEICSETCHRAVYLTCCEGSTACRGCGVKHVTSNRSCWACSKSNIRSEDLESDQLVRDAINHHKDEGDHDKSALNKIFQRKILFLKDMVKRKDEQSEKERSDKEVINGQEEVLEPGEEPDDDISEKKRSPTPEKKSSKRDRTSSRERRRDKKKHKHKDDHNKRDDKRKRKHRDRSRERHRSRDREKRDRSRDKRRSPTRKDERSPSPEKNEIKKENGVGSFAALQKRIRIENELVEKKVKERIEEYISSMVTQQLRVRKSEIEKEVLKKVDLARQNMEEEVKLEIDLMRKLREAEEKKKMDEINSKMAEKERALEEEKKKLAEDRLAILEHQMKIEKEKQKEKKKQEKKSKQEQMKILGKDKSRPKLSFSLTKS